MKIQLEDCNYYYYFFLPIIIFVLNTLSFVTKKIDIKKEFSYLSIYYEHTYKQLYNIDRHSKPAIDLNIMI